MEADDRDSIRISGTWPAIGNPDGTLGPGGAKREPRQERGQRRVDEILDATEALILEIGAAACSIQELANRSGASVGSIYHFFPTKEAIFDALRERYFLEAQSIAEEMKDSSAKWAMLDLPSFVQHLISPFVDFLERRPAQYELAVTPPGMDQAHHAAMHDTLREALELAFECRWPDTSPEERALRAQVVGAIGHGLGRLLKQAPPAMRRQVGSQFALAITGYLSTFEGELPNR